MFHTTKQFQSICQILKAITPLLSKKTSTGNDLRPKIEWVAKQHSRNIVDNITIQPSVIQAKISILVWMLDLIHQQNAQEKIYVTNKQLAVAVMHVDELIRDAAQ